MNYYNEIKKELINNETYKRVKDYSKNRSDLTTYYNVGKLLIEAQGGEERAKYGDGIIKEYSKKLTEELGKGYSTRNLKNMRKFYLYQKKSDTICPFSNSDKLLYSSFLNWAFTVCLITILTMLKKIIHYRNLRKHFKEKGLAMKKEVI